MWADAPWDPNTQMCDPEVTTEGSWTVTSRKPGAGGFSTADAGWINVVRASIPAAQAARAARLVAFIMALLYAHGPGGGRGVSRVRQTYNDVEGWAIGCCDLVCGPHPGRYG